MEWKNELGFAVQRMILNSVEWIKKYDLIIAFFMLLLLLFLLYYKINIPDIQDWDEARHGANAYEMLRYHHFFINYYGGAPDYWNLKPPLSFWLVMVGFKMFGFNVLGLRFFSGFSIVMTAIAIFFFARNRFGRIAGLTALASFMTCGPIILDHCGRTADPDALFLLFTTLAIICLVLTERNSYYLYLTGLFFSLAFLTKSWHAFSILIIVGLYYVLTGKILRLKFKSYLLYFLVSFVPILPWAIERYRFDGFVFFAKMVQYDLISRSSSAIEGHAGGKLYYLNFIINSYTYWFILFCGLVVAMCIIINRNSWIVNKSVGIGLLLWLVVPLGIFSLSKSKLFWYIYIIFPAISIFIGLAVNRLMELKKAILTCVLAIAIVFSFSLNFLNIYRTIRLQEPFDIQTVFSQLNRNSQYSLANVYTDDSIQWTQSTYLSALLFGDLKPQDTGVTGFAYDQKKNSLLVMANNTENQKIINDFQFHHVYSDSQYILVSK